MPQVTSVILAQFPLCIWLVSHSLAYSRYSFLGYSFYFFSCLELVIAQSPCHMKGHTVALLCTFRKVKIIDWGIVIFIISLLFPVHCFAGWTFYHQHMIYVLILHMEQYCLCQWLCGEHILSTSYYPVPYHMFAENYNGKYIYWDQKQHWWITNAM